MTKPMTPERLKEIKARCEAATEGPWDNNTMYCAVVGRTMINYGLDERLDVFVVMAKYKGDVALVSNIRPESEQKANGQFIAHARQDLPDSTAEIERLQAREDEWAKLLKSANNDVERLNEYINTLQGE